MIDQQAEQPRFLPASSFTLDAFAEIFTRSFEAYFYESTATAATLAARVRVENIDLSRTLVMLVGDEPAGQALLSLRGARAWCGGFGVLAAFRGRGLAHPLAAALVEQARQSGARSFGLEVLTRNAPAIKTYARAGLQVQRDLLVLEWRRPEESAPPAVARAVEVAAPAYLLEHFAALHALPAAWQRDLPSLLVWNEPQTLMVARDGRPAAYVLFYTNPEGVIRIVDLGAERAEDVLTLLGALQDRGVRIVDVNEPADSPFIAAFAAAGFVEIDRQYEMMIELA
jgi:ribosomal protein S18 acetylase RimI-like enzyme